MLLRKSPLDVTERDLEIIIEVLLSRRVAGYVDCLEWGAGASTVFFPRLLEDRRIPYRWTSIEHNPEWMSAVLAEGRTLNIEVNFFPTQNTREDSMNDYDTFPLRMGRRFDFIFIDGRKRKRCLLTAAKVLAPNGVAILHDAHREYYHAGFQAFARGDYAGDDLWIGRNSTA